MRTLLAAILVLLLPVSAFADTAYNGVYVDRYLPTDLGINGALLSSSPTFTVRSVGLSTWTIYVTLARAAATDLRMICKAGPRASTLRTLPVATPGADGTITEVKAQFGWYSITASDVYGFVVSPVLDDTLKCTLSGTAASTDTISVEARGQTP